MSAVHPSDQWLLDLKQRNRIRLKNVNRMKAELELELEKIDEILYLKAENRRMADHIAGMRAGNDQLRAEIKDLQTQEKKKSKKGRKHG